MQLIKTWFINKYLPDYTSALRKAEELDYFAKFFPKFVDPQVVSFQQRSELTTDGKIKDICVMFTDVRGFTSFSQNVSLPAANSFLNNFYDIVVHHTHAYGGVIDKFMGDGTMSIFGSLDKSRNYVRKCIAAAQAILRDFKAMTNQKAEPNLFLGVGVSQGPAMVGTFGNGDYINFTAIGPTVNLAARVQACAKNNNIYVTKEVTSFLDDEEYISRGRFELKNIPKRVPLYEVLV